jgi:hypothetical protein
MSATLNKITTRAKQIRKKHPSMKWTSAIKQASSELRKSGTIGRTGIKKKVVRKKRKIHQTGTSVKHLDILRKAKAPGKRKSSAGNRYYEYRKNRSDMPGSLSGVSESQLKGAMIGKLETSLGSLYVKRDRSKLKRDKKKYQKQITEVKRKITKYK